MAKQKTWEQQRAETIAADLRADYGKGWDRLSDDQKNALIAERVLRLVLAQVGEQCKPAQDMVRNVLRETKHSLFGDA